MKALDDPTSPRHWLSFSRQRHSACLLSHLASQRRAFHCRRSSPARCWRIRRTTLPCRVLLSTYAHSGHTRTIVRATLRPFATSVRLSRPHFGSARALRDDCRGVSLCGRTRHQMTPTPNHALQPTGLAVTAPASGPPPSPPAVQGPRQRGPWLSLGSLGVLAPLP